MYLSIYPSIYLSILVDGNDSDDLIISAFKAYDIEGKIDVKMFQHALRTWGDKMTQASVSDILRICAYISRKKIGTTTFKKKLDTKSCQ